MPEIASIILAGGEGVRMQSTLPKVMHPLCGRPIIDYPLNLAKDLKAKRIVVVTPPAKENLLSRHLRQFKWVSQVVQPKSLGTGDAVRVCFPLLKNFKGFVLIFCADTPLLKSKTLKLFVENVHQTDATLGFISTRFENPEGCGRVVRNASEIEKIVEEKEASFDEKRIKEINTGVYCVKSSWLFETIKALKPHPFSEEYYLPDIVREAIRQKQKIVGFFGEDPLEFLGINTQKQLAVAAKALRCRLIEHWMARGVVFTDLDQVYLEADVSIGKGTILEPQVYLQGKTVIGKNCHIECGAVLKDMIVGDRVHVKPYSILEGSRIEKEAVIGPFARIRPETYLGKGARIGNFVELKKAKLGAGVKANHLSYLGDAEIGAETNIGCGTITCNYDGVKKHPTKIGKKVFVGSDVQFVAPVKIGDGAFIGAGSTITENVPGKALGIARGRQVNKKNWSQKKKKIRN